MHGRRSRGGQGGQVPPEFGAGGTLIQIVSPRFCHIGTKMSVLWPSKYAKIRFRPGLCPRPRWGSSRSSPRHLSRLERGHPSPYTTPLDTDPSSALAMRPPRARSPARSTPMDARCVNSLLLWALNYLFASHFASRGRDTLPAVVHLCVHAETEN